MKFTLSWLKDHLETSASINDIAAKLTAIGLEVERLEDPAAALDDFIVGHVTEAKQHPNAARLRVCTVDTGTETLQVVCGAPNAHTNMKAVLARIGTVIPASGDKLKKSKIRGKESQGMLCSARELKLGEDHEGIIELPPEARAGAPIADILVLDPVIEITLTPNRVDALGVRGVARDLAAAGLGTLKYLNDTPVHGAFENAHKVAMNLPADEEYKCPQFVGRAIRGVKNGQSPVWLKDRLNAVGLRPISALVDITQYITLDLGRPLHVFDDAKLIGAVGPRLANNGESIAALNGKTYELDSSMVVISDEMVSLGIGGVIGGEPSGVTDTTTAVFLESALFNPFNIAETGRKLQINSDARYCFERGVDSASGALGAEVATRMILEICGGEASQLEIGGRAPAHQRKISFDPTRVKSLGGVDVAEGETKSILERLGFVVVTGSPWTVSPPSWRSDVEGWQDLVEEILRIHGYDKIPETTLPRAPVPRVVSTPQQRRIAFARRTLAGRGLNETTTWSFLPKAQAELFLGDLPIVLLANPISSELDALRPSLIPNLAAAAGRNATRDMANSRFFEIGPRFEGSRPGEQVLIACVLRAGHTGPRHWAGGRRPVDALDIKADALAALQAAGLPVSALQSSAGPDNGAPSWYHPGRSGTLKLGNQVLAVFGELHPAVLAALDVKAPMVACEVFIDRLPQPQRFPAAARPLLKTSSFQPVDRDFAFVVDTTVAAESLLRAVRGADKELISDVGLFDTYEGPHIGNGKKSLAVAVTLQPQDSTLTDKEIDAVAKKIVSAVKNSCGGTLRA